MQEKEYPLKTRHYTFIKKLLQEVEQDISEEGMRRRCMAISILQEYMLLPSNPSLMTSAEGALAGMVFTMPAYTFTGDQNPIRKIYFDLIRKLPDYTDLYLLVHQSIVKDLKKWLTDNNLLHRTNLHVLPDQHNITVWAEDGFELINDSSNKKICLVQPHSHRRTPDGHIGYSLSKAFGWEASKVPLFFEGGNMLVGDDFILLGTDHAVETFRDWNGDLMEGKSRVSRLISDVFQKYLDKERSLYFVGCSVQLHGQKERKVTITGEEWTEVIYLKNTEGTVQPIFHIDMFITLAGRNSKGKYQLLVGDPRMAEVTPSDESLTVPDAFDEIAETLIRMGFEVIRNPLPLVYVDDPEIKVRKWYFASYNNALVEIKPDSKTIWLPTYGHGNWKELEKADQENKRIWEELGFKVILLEDFNPLAENAGSAHCIKKYIRERI